MDTVVTAKKIYTMKFHRTILLIGDVAQTSGLLFVIV